ncbi:hypothetical protein [Paenibacillus jilunlii]|uniref:hypothetical protein n=1 Tax=Paenibacillus jilunlii TaxID=682956 RepID=UPI00115FFDB4|nr:hypothetical protein [Paenibacillus jilunlii]
MRANVLKKAKVKDSAARSAAESFFVRRKLKSAAHSAIDAAGASAWLTPPQSAGQLRPPQSVRLASSAIGPPTCVLRNPPACWVLRDLPTGCVLRNPPAGSSAICPLAASSAIRAIADFYTPVARLPL